MVRSRTKIELGLRCATGLSQVWKCRCWFADAGTGCWFRNWSGSVWSLVVQKLLLGATGSGTAGLLEVWLAAASSSRGIYKECSKETRGNPQKTFWKGWFEWESRGDWVEAGIGCDGSAVVIGWIPRRLLAGSRDANPTLVAGGQERHRYLPLGTYARRRWY